MKKRANEDHIRHVISSECIRDIDSSIIWHYSTCSCGWEGAHVATRELDTEEVRKHIVNVEGTAQ